MSISEDLRHNTNYTTDVSIRLILYDFEVITFGYSAIFSLQRLGELKYKEKNTCPRQKFRTQTGEHRGNTQGITKEMINIYIVLKNKLYTKNRKKVSNCNLETAVVMAESKSSPHPLFLRW